MSGRCAFYLFIRQPHGSEVSPAARNTLDSARIPRASKLLICGLFLKGRVLAQDGIVKDLFGHTWSIATLVEDVPLEEMDKRASESAKKQGKG